MIVRNYAKLFGKVLMVLAIGGAMVGSAWGQDQALSDHKKIAVAAFEYELKGQRNNPSETCVSMAGGLQIELKGKPRNTALREYITEHRLEDPAISEIAAVLRARGYNVSTLEGCKETSVLFYVDPFKYGGETHLTVSSGYQAGPLECEGHRLSISKMNNDFIVTKSDMSFIC